MPASTTKSAPPDPPCSSRQKRLRKNAKSKDATLRSDGFNYPTRERAQHGADVVDEVVTLQAAVVVDSYDPVRRESLPIVMVPAETARVFRVRNGVEELHRRGAITDAQKAAGDRWFRDFTTGLLGAPDLTGGGRGGSDIHSMMLSRAGASGRATEAGRAIGRSGVALLSRVLVDGFSIRAVAKERGKSVDRVSGAIEVVLEVLAEHYDEIDRAARRARRLAPFHGSPPARPAIPELLQPARITTSGG